MKPDAVNINEKMKMINELWTPKIIEQMNSYHIKLVKIEGDFTWHKHDETDEVFYVIEGEMNIDFRDKTISLKAGELYVVRKGAEHKPHADKECCIMLIEPAGTVNTGDAGGEQTAANDVWI